MLHSRRGQALTCYLAPVLDYDNVIEYQSRDFANEFAHQTEYRGPPTPELETAWDRLWNRGSMELPLGKPSLLNRTEDELSHVHNDETRGYRSLLEVFHQLHCLVTLSRPF